jgi:serine/threonine protein kinase
LVVRLIDFGLSVTWGTGDELLKRAAGSLAFMAPEVAARKPYDGCKADAWSTGVCVAAMLRGELPFDAESEEALSALVIGGDTRAWEAASAQHVSASAVAFVRRLLTCAPDERSGVAEACAHAWLSEGPGRSASARG